MTIAILCPNGHKLTCPDQLAGKAGKCPHCGATFRVPELVTPTGHVAAVEAAPGSSPRVGAAPVPLAPQQPPPLEPANEIRPYDEQSQGALSVGEIVFLCPEGHHLRGPESLAGQAGECPLCGIRFLVPSPEDVITEHPTGFDLSEAFGSVGEGAFGAVGGGESESAGRAMGRLFGVLWHQQQPGMCIELDLGEGRVFMPSGFAPDSAQHSHGLFMGQEANGTLTMTLIAWDAIERVAVRGLREVPSGVQFEFVQ